MGLFDWLFSRRKPREPDGQRDLWNSEGVDRLLNEDLHQAIEAVAVAPTPENRRRLYQLLMGTTYCIPSAGGSDEGSSPAIRVSQNESGERILVAFTDPCALKRWEHNPPALAVFTAPKLFELLLADDFVQIQINPAGPAGGQLSRSEVELLARGVMPI